MIFWAGHLRDHWEKSEVLTVLEYWMPHMGQANWCRFGSSKEPLAFHACSQQSLGHMARQSKCLHGKCWFTPVTMVLRYSKNLLGPKTDSSA